MQATDLHNLEVRVLERIRERFDLPADAEVIVAESDNGDEDWELPVHVTVYLPDGEDAYGLADLGAGSLDEVVDYLLDQVAEGLPIGMLRESRV